MDLLLPGMRPHLERWERRAFSRGVERGPGPGDRRDEYRRALAAEPPGEPLASGPYRRVAEAILHYRVFPRRFVEAVVRRSIEVGDTVGARHWLPLGFSLFFASRAVQRFDGRDGGVWRTGFTYRTLEGHPTLGEETFAVEKDLASGEVRAALSAWSRPGLVLTRLGAPLAVRQQRLVNAAALDELARVARAP